jgi:hypothetical protein
MLWKSAAALLVVGVASAEVRTICLEDRVALDAFSRKAFETEIRKLVPLQGLSLTSGTCSGPAVSLVISTHPPARYARALGLAHRNGDRVFPLLEIYTQPIRKLLGEQPSAAQLGRALARVAAHELGHYLRQQLHHEETGLMRASFNSTVVGQASPPVH